MFPWNDNINFKKRQKNFIKIKKIKKIINIFLRVILTFLKVYKTIFI